MGIIETFNRFQSGLISKSEALSELETTETRARHDRDYCDTFDEYRRQQSIIASSQRHQAYIRRHGRINGSE